MPRCLPSDNVFLHEKSTSVLTIVSPSLYEFYIKVHSPKCLFTSHFSFPAAPSRCQCASISILYIIRWDKGEWSSDAASCVNIWMWFSPLICFAGCSLFTLSHGLAACERVCFGAQRGPGSSLVLTDSVESLQLFQAGHKGEHLIGTECRDRGFQFGQGCRDTHFACCVCVFCFVTFVLPSHITHYNPPQSLESPTPPTYRKL